MSVDIVRAWKDEQYRMSLTESERANLPANPAGMVELTDADLDGVAGGLERDAVIDTSIGKTSCCTSTVATACC
ncbi:mersacidin/lichenicidin family type 2 lantibiotic [Archangium gephyra]|uniref:mersacidin/lichenicidin family type 2 lantibiotic n=1 Tax=Archangium gephyra TaxID=48 RepID=UPI003B824466